MAEESAVVDGQKLYEFTVNAAPTKESLKEGQSKYGVAVVNPGESFYYSDGRWIDWKDAISMIKEMQPEVGNYELDNFSIKAYMVEASDDEVTPNLTEAQTVKVPKAPKTGDSIKQIFRY